MERCELDFSHECHMLVVGCGSMRTCCDGRWLRGGGVGLRGEGAMHDARHEAFFISLAGLELD
jgi:hypothetical protein